ncbi:MAG: cationic amino acid transporter (CAT) family transporter [Acidobacteria bacterium OLB17]|nr:MAG: cationic amino acid transporter (CAT) family transporter [Acidobacteria bacterium OLB17]MCZ2390852.1 amino acid permease [Acidobacteriota bacterium]
MSLFATKPISRIIAEAEETGEHALKKALSALDLTMLGIGAIIGTGIFVLTGQAAGKHAGPAVVLSMILAGIVSAFAALCYSEFAASVPISGSAYAYGYGTLGEFVAWIIGWDLILEYAFGAATVAVGWSGYTVSLMRENLGINFPIALSAPPGAIKDTAGNVIGHGIFNLPAALIAVAVTLLLIRGIKESASFNSLIVIIKVIVVVLFIVAGIGFVNTDNIGIGCTVGAPGCAEFMPYGFSGIITGAAVIFFAYIGFDAVSTAAQEAKNPQRDMPRGILGSLAICTVLYILVSGVMVGLVDYKALKEAAAPLATAIDEALKANQGATAGVMGTILAIFSSWIIKIGAVLGLSSTMVVMTMGQPRVFYSMSKDGLLPEWAAKIHPKFQTPHVTTAITGTIVAILAGFVPISLLGELVSIGTLFAFVIVGTGIIILRSSNPTLNRPFKVPLVPFIPLGAVLSAAFLMNSLPLDTWIRLIDWMAIGLLIYFGYSYTHSRLATEEMAADELPANYKPPISAILGIVLVVALTIYQVMAPSSGLGLGLEPDKKAADDIGLNLAIRLFAWLLTGALVFMIMYGKRGGSLARSAKTKSIGLVLSIVNILLWGGVTWWYFQHIHDKVAP